METTIEVAGLRKRFGRTLGFLVALAAEGRTVLVSSHLMSELQDTHRATLEEAYMELTRDAVEYRAQSAG